MKLLTIIFFFTILPAISLQAQDSTSYENKVRKMLELSGAADNFNLVVSNLLDLQRESYQELLSQEFFDELEKEMIEVGLDKLIPKFIPIYKKHLTESDLDGIINFYESDLGKKLTSKTPLILQDAMDVGAEWGQEVAVEIYNRIENSNELKFNKVIEDDCSAFKEGIFETYDGENKYSLERKDGIQIEEFNNEITRFKITWLSNNRYSLKKLNESKDSNLNEELIINIYEVNGNSCKWIAQFVGIDFFVEGELIKIK